MFTRKGRWLDYDEALVPSISINIEVEKKQKSKWRSHKFLGHKHPSTLTTQHNIASCLLEKGNYDEALVKFIEVEKSQIEILDHKHPSMLTTQHNIAYCLFRKGNYSEALVKYIEVEKSDIEILGHKHPSTAYNST